MLTNTSKPELLSTEQSIIYSIIIFIGGCIGCIFPHLYFMFKVKKHQPLSDDSGSNQNLPPITLDIFTTTIRGYKLRLG